VLWSQRRFSFCNEGVEESLTGSATRTCTARATFPNSHGRRQPIQVGIAPGACPSRGWFNSPGRAAPGRLLISQSRSVKSPPSWNEGGFSGVPSHSRRSNRPPHARQTMNSSLNVSYGPQSRPCVSTEVTNRKSPAGEPQSGQAILYFSFDSNVLRKGQCRRCSRVRNWSRPFFAQIRSPP